MTALTLTLGIGGGFASEKVIAPSTHEYLTSKPYKPLYPAMVDNVPTNNEESLTAFTEGMEDRRAKHIAQEKAQERAKAKAKVIAAEKARAEQATQRQASAKVVRSQTKQEQAKERPKQTIVASRSTAPPKSPAITFEATAYIALCNSGCTGITATGVDVRNTIYHAGQRVIAVDPNVIPLGSIVRVNTGDSSFTAIAADTGGHIDGYRIDILVGSQQEALNFGRRAVSVQILK